MLTQEEANYLFYYDPINGKLYWKHPRAHRLKEGDEAGTLHHLGYMQTQVGEKIYRNHRIIWLMHYGYLPKVLDHIDHDRLNNKIENLREVTYSENCKNITKPKNNTSGVVGVSFNKRLNKWYSQIRSEKVKYYLGTFNSFEEAVKARKEAEVKYGFHKNHGDNR